MRPVSINGLLSPLARTVAGERGVKFPSVIFSCIMPATFKPIKFNACSGVYLPSIIFAPNCPDKLAI